MATQNNVFPANFYSLRKTVKSTRYLLAKGLSAVAVMTHSEA